MRTGSMQQRVRFRAFLLALLSVALREASTAERNSFELRGVVIAESGVSLDGTPVTIQLHALSGVWSGKDLSAVPDSRGMFRYKRLPTGMYLLTVFVPRVTRIRRTVEVGPSLADKDGHIEVRIPLPARRPGSGVFQVRAGEFPLSTAARKEYEQGLQQVKDRNLDRAVEHFRRALNLAPEYPAAWYQLAAIASHQQRFGEAANLYRETLKLQPDNYRALVDLGEVLLMLRDGQGAVEVNARTVKMRPDDSQALVQFGYSLMLVERLEEAEVYLKKASAIDPANYSYPQLMLAEIYRRRKDLPSVKREFEEFLRLHPDSPKAREIRPALDELRLLLK